MRHDGNSVEAGTDVLYSSEVCRCGRLGRRDGRAADLWTALRTKKVKHLNDAAFIT